MDDLKRVRPGWNSFFEIGSLYSHEGFAACGDSSESAPERWRIDAGLAGFPRPRR